MKTCRKCAQEFQPEHHRHVVCRVCVWAEMLAEWAHHICQRCDREYLTLGNYRRKFCDNCNGVGGKVYYV